MFHCKTCFGKKFYIKEVGPHIGLYCYNCGQFLKWGKQSDIDLLRVRNQLKERENTK